MWSELFTTFRNIPLVSLQVDSSIDTTSSGADSAQDEEEISRDVENQLLTGDQNSEEGVLRGIGDEGDDPLPEISTPYPSDTGCESQG